MNLQQQRAWILQRAASAVLMLVVVLVLNLIETQSVQAQTFTVLYSLTGGADGGLPYAGVVRDIAGNLYGTTYFGGSSNQGTVFKLDTSSPARGKAGRM